MSKKPNLVQRPTGPTIYPSIVLPPVVSIPLQPTVAPSRPGSAPMIPADKGPSNRPGPMTNTPNTVR
jgi:hypothetical protein